MLDYEALFDDLADMGLSSWREALHGLLRERLSDSAHGKLRHWRATLSEIPAVDKLPADLNTPAITTPETNHISRSELKSLLLRLIPWRKGPFTICGVRIDSEWRSDLKWDRIKDAITPLTGRNVLDVGCGNGYYTLRMRGMGAKLVIGVDPTLLYVIQFLAIRHFMKSEPVHVLPIRLHELPADSARFDTVFSMGVLSHERSPEDHLLNLHSSVRAGGELVLETLILPGPEVIAKMPEDRYARMRNVWLLPTVPMLEQWLENAGFENIRPVDISRTTTEEQRTTEWMPFESLAEALDPADPSRTIEGWPAPRRAALVCTKP